MDVTYLAKRHFENYIKSSQKRSEKQLSTHAITDNTLIIRMTYHVLWMQLCLSKKTWKRV